MNVTKGLAQQQRGLQVFITEVALDGIRQLSYHYWVTRCAVQLPFPNTLLSYSHSNTLLPNTVCSVLVWPNTISTVFLLYEIWLVIPAYSESHRVIIFCFYKYMATSPLYTEDDCMFYHTECNCPGQGLNPWPLDFSQTIDLAMQAV